VQLFRVPVEVGRLSTGGKPDGAALVVELASLAEQGVTVLVSALPDDEVAEAGLSSEGAAAQALGLRFLALPIVDLGVPSAATLSRAADELTALVQAGEHVHIHCWAGIGRSSLLAAAVLVRLGRRPEEAWAAVSAARGLPVPDTEEQRRLLAGWAADGG